MISAVILLVIGLVFLSYLRWEQSSFVKRIDQIPGPPKIPVLGSLLLIPRDPHGKHINDPEVVPFPA